MHHCYIWLLSNESSIRPPARIIIDRIENCFLIDLIEFVWLFFKIYNFIQRENNNIKWSNWKYVSNFKIWHSYFRFRSKSIQSFESSIEYSIYDNK